ncbi:hypothetical protein [Clostridium sp. BSD2780061688b_171218_E8]|nr:hypothetical protein [Clostridium sp. BSD2780061688b_171218_E8]
MLDRYSDEAAGEMPAAFIMERGGMQDGGNSKIYAGIIFMDDGSWQAD